MTGVYRASSKGRGGGGLWQFRKLTLKAVNPLIRGGGGQVTPGALYSLTIISACIERLALLEIWTVWYTATKVHRYKGTQL